MQKETRKIIKMLNDVYPRLSPAHRLQFVENVMVLASEELEANPELRAGYEELRERLKKAA